MKAKRPNCLLIHCLIIALQEGRLAVLDALSAVVAKFPQEALDEHSESLALPLVLRLVNDPAPACVSLLIASLDTETEPCRLASEAHSAAAGERLVGDPAPP